MIGQASVIDGDTPEIQGSRISIFGIDAPESDQLCHDERSNYYRCGIVALSNALRWTATGTGEPCLSVTLAGTDIAAWLVRNRLAPDWLQYSKGGYAEAIWRGLR